MYDVYTRINNTHMRSWQGLRLVTVSDSELLLRSMPTPNGVGLAYH